jgi:aryl-alcohol dehydrogenase-like predicted oxidoreductase
MHWANPDKQIEEAWSVMQELARAGKIRYAGVSNCTTNQMSRLKAIYPIASQQPPYNMLNRSIEDELLGYCKENNIGMVTYSPIEKGLLTGKFNAEKIAQLPPDDVRLKDPQYAEPLLTENMKLIEGLMTIAMRNDKTMAQLAIAWVLRKPEITAAIVGARKPGQITETAKAADWILNTDDIEEIEELLTARKG